MLKKTPRAFTQHLVTSVGWINDESRGGYSEMIAKSLKTVRSSIDAVASLKLLLTTAKILAACIVAVTIMLLLVGGTTTPGDARFEGRQWLKPEQP